MSSNGLLAVLTGLLGAAAVIAAVTAFRPVMPDLADTLNRLHRSTNPRPQTPVEGESRDRFGRWLMSRSSSLPSLATPYADLDLIGMTPARFFASKAVWAAIGLVFPALLGTIFWVLGFAIPFTIPAVLSLVCALLGWVFPNLAIRRDAVAARERFARSITAYIDLVVLERLGGAGVASAIADPAAIATAPLFVRIRQSLDRHRLERQAPWTALRKLGESIELPELTELADTLELTGTKSTPVAETLKARARDIRNAFLNKDVERASAASQRQTAVTAVLLVCFLAFLGTPLLLRLLAS